MRALELRRADGTGGVTRMVPSDGPKAHGLMGALHVLDELHAHRDGALYEAFRSGLAKRSDARMVTIGTADVGPERPLSRVRARALAAPPDPAYARYHLNARVLALHASNAIQRSGRRGWRLDKPDRSSPIDSLIALLPQCKGSSRAPIASRPPCR